MKTKRISADEAIAKARESGRVIHETARGLVVAKAAKAPSTWNSEARSARFVMSSQGVDRYGDIVVTDGLDTTEFERNPVGLLFHNSRGWPVGNWSNLEKMLKTRPPRLEGDLNLLPEGGPIPEIDQTAWMLENGGIRTSSIGFVPDWNEIEYLLDDEERWTGGLQYNKSELVECSVVPVPAQPDAIAKMLNGDLSIARQVIEDILDNWAKTPAGLLISRKEFEEKWRTVETPRGAMIFVGHPAQETPAPPAEDVERDRSEKGIIAKVRDFLDGLRGEEKPAKVKEREEQAPPAEVKPSKDEVEAARQRAKAASARIAKKLKI